MWTAELDAVKAQIFDIYNRPGGAYDVFYREWNAPEPAPLGGLSRLRASPYPMHFYWDTPVLKTLYSRAITLACTSGSYADLIDVLEWLQTNCPEQGRCLYFSNAILRNPEIDKDHVTKCAYAFIVGAILDRFGYDVIEDTDSGDVGVVHTKLVERATELSCEALPFLAALRVAIYPTKYGRDARNGVAISGSHWLEFARTIVQDAPEMSIDDIVRSLINEERRPAREAAWARRRAAVLAYAAVRME